MSMETVNEAAVVSEVPESQPVETAAKTAVETPKTPEFKPTEAPSLEAAGVPEQPKYEPNFKFKVLDKEQEFDEFVRDAIKDADTEKKVRELYEKAYGLDFVKRERDRVRQEAQQYRSQVDPLVNEVKELGTFLQEKDFDKFFAKFNLPEEAIVNWVADKLRYKQMSPEQRAVYDNQRQLKDRVYEQSSAVQSAENQLNQMRIEQTTFYIDQIKSDPQVTKMAEQFDSRAGKQGAFWDRALAWADHMCEVEGRFVPFNVAFNDFKSNFYFGQDQAAEEGQVAPPPQAKPVVTAPQAEKPTIRNIPSTSQSAVKKTVRSLDDLKKKYNEMSGSRVEQGRR